MGFRDTQWLATRNTSTLPSLYACNVINPGVSLKTAAAYEFFTRPTP